MSRSRLDTGILGERVASLETATLATAKSVTEHEIRLDGHDALLNQIRGALRLMVVLWALLTSAAGLGVVKYLVSAPVSHAGAKP